MRKRKIMVLVILLVIGFASVSTTLILNGVVGIASNEDDFDVIFTSARLDGRKRNDLIGEKKKDINFETRRLTNINEEAVLNYEVTNASRIYDADVVISCNIVDEEENVIESNEYIVMQYEPKSMTVEAGKTESGSITAKLIKASTTEQSINIKCTLNASATERDELGSEYIVDKGLMIPVNFTTTESGSIKTQGYFWDYRESITKVVFEEKEEDRTNAAYTFDVSKNQDESVMSYLVANANDNTKYTLYIQSEDKVILNPISNDFFDEFYLLEQIDGLERVDTSNVTSMYAFFYGCEKLKSIDLTNFDTSNVTNMGKMFYNCSSLTTLDLTNFNTKNVTNLNGMFNNCIALTALDLTNFNTKNVTNMNGMFGVNDTYITQGNALTEIKGIDSFNTSNVTDMGYIFRGCSNLTNLDLSKWDTSNVTSMRQTFRNCSKLTNLDIRNFNFDKVTEAANMFFGMPGNAIVIVKDIATQDKVLNSLPSVVAPTYPKRPDAWTTANVVVAA